MEQQGLVADYDGRGGLSSDTQTTEQNKLWVEAFDECGEKHGLDAPWSVDELKRLYELEVKNHQCLLDAGYESEPPPSEQVYVDSWLQEREPYQSVKRVAETDAALFLEATQVCPAPLWSFG